MEKYSDEEVDRLYLGKPIQDGSEHIYGGLVDLIVFTDEETKNLFMGLPMMSKLVNVPTKVED